MAGKATTTLKLPVSLQIVLRALIEEGLKQDNDRALWANVARQALTVRRIRTRARKPETLPAQAAATHTRTAAPRR